MSAAPESGGRQPHLDRVAIVTGAGRAIGGLGADIAARLAREGARVLVSDLDPAISEVARKLAADTGVDVLAHHGTLASRANVEAMVALAIGRWGKVDILVNNAGGGIIRPFLQHTEESLRETVDRNLWTAVWCCHVVLPHMVNAGYGRIINIGADSLRNGLWNHAGYNAAKGGVVGMSSGIAREFAEYDITINTVSPCGMNTPNSRTINVNNQAMNSKYISVIPKGRRVEMYEVSAYVSFLAGPEASFITGQHLSVNGGSAML